MTNQFIIRTDNQNNKRIPLSDDNRYIDNWIKKARKWRRQGIPLDVTLENVKLEFQRMKLGITSHYHQKIQDNTFVWEEDQAQVDDIKARYDHFVQCEKSTISDRKFALIDKLLARLNALKSRIDEMKNYMSNIKNKDYDSKEND